VAELALLLAAAVAAGAGGLALRALRERPQRGVLVLAALAPFNGLLPLVPGGSSAAYWKEALLVLTLLATLVAPRRSLRGVDLPAPSLPWWPAIAVLTVFGSVSALVTAGLEGLLAIKITFFYLLILLVLWRAPFTARDRDHLVSIVMLLGPVTALVGLWQQFVGPAYLVSLGYTYNDQVRTAGGLLRSFSTFNQPFPFGLYVMTSLLVGGAVALAEPRRLRNALFLCAVPVMVVGMGVSIVRASYLGLIVGLLWLGVHRYRTILKALAAVVVVAPIAVLLTSPRLLAPLVSSSSLDQRGAGWSSIVSDVLNHPFGLGLGASGSAAARIALANGRAEATTYQPDNYYVKMALELGPVGLWLFILVIISAAVSTLRAARVLRGRDGALALGVSASVVAAAAASFVATYLEIFPLDVYFWLLLGVVGCSVSQHAAECRANMRRASASARSPSDPAEVVSRPTPVS
jgi:polysaccharide biosynthesis protein PslJ